MIDKADALSKEEVELLGQKAKKRIKDAYSWEYICQRYLETWKGMIDKHEN